ncbi:hypothetical protein TrCOL_g884 [Triparma columacea]|uniref:Fatty acid desaturase domain-containing protein n=1 Tax=Triparma columacea TaxID=722753 RepID=A0A9W7GQ11_9STRA|nr:hypothetical protein TrCOL_g884 [Triparma columacea]
MIPNRLHRDVTGGFPWEVHVTPEDSYDYVGYTVLFCVTFQIIARQVALVALGPSSPKRGVAPRVAVKLVSVLFDTIAVLGGIKHLLFPDASVVEDPIYGFSPHSQFHFSVAAGYFAWAAVVSAIYRGSKVSIFHHIICCMVYLGTLSPFMHGVGNIYLLFQASTLIIDCYSCGKLLTNRKTPTNMSLKYIHPFVFVLVRIVIGLPLSVKFLYDMSVLLSSGAAKNPPLVYFFVVVNLAINALNTYWAIGMALGIHRGMKPACSVTSESDEGSEKKVNFFDISFNISFGDRGHKRLRTAKKSNPAYDNTSPAFSLPVAIVALCSFLAKSITNKEDMLSLKDDAGAIVEVLKVPALVGAAAYSLFKIFSYFGSEIFDEAKYDQKGDGHLYTRIRGQWYDLAKFQHPGGPVALNLAKGRDGTALFESHHYLMSHKALYGVLNKYKVDAEVAKTIKTIDPRDDGAHYVWDKYEEDPFTVDIKKMIVDHFKPIAKARGITLREATKATPQRWLMILSLMAAFFATIPYFVAGRWWTLIATPQLAWVIIANYWHDGLHFSMSCDWRVNAILPYLFPWLSSPWMWYHQHVIGHHAYTNVDHKDPDLAHAPQLMREHKSVKWRPAHKRQHGFSFYFVWSVAAGLGLQVLSDVRANLKGTYNNVVPYAKLSPARLYAHTLGRLFYACSLFVWPWFVFPAWKALIWCIIPISTFSWSFMLNSQINHLTEHCAHASSPHFLRHQVLTAQDFGVGRSWCQFFSGGLNQQIEHHMFPCVNHCHLPDLAPKVKALCEKHGVKYNEVRGYREALKTHLKHTEAMGVRPFSVGHEH